MVFARRDRGHRCRHGVCMGRTPLFLCGARHCGRVRRDHGDRRRVSALRRAIRRCGACGLGCVGPNERRSSASPSAFSCSPGSMDALRPRGLQHRRLQRAGDVSNRDVRPALRHPLTHHRLAKWPACGVACRSPESPVIRRSHWSGHFPRTAPRAMSVGWFAVTVLAPPSDSSSGSLRHSTPGSRETTRCRQGIVAGIFFLLLALGAWWFVAGKKRLT